MGITKEDLDRIKEEAARAPRQNSIRVGYSTCGVAAGADVVYSALCDEAKARGIDVAVMKCGCLGLCSAEPLVEVDVDGAPHVYYGKVTRDVALKIIDEHVCQKKLVDNHIFEF
ncbi:MAG: (2Fe-2S) ferredoxin domain-containing protein [Candidatus Omnitrophica bacterium]|nr:(2Fe-2S) ferredoxin domain-containing protein [Candidatus Omnitrophota bacterium]